MNNLFRAKASLLFPLLAFGCILGAQTAPQPIGEFATNDLRLQSVASDSVVFGGHIQIRAREKAEVQRISFRDVTVAGAPVFISNFEQKFEIQSNQMTVLPGEIQITAYFRDASPEVVERILASDKVRIEGTVNILVDLNLVQSVAMMRRNVPSQLHFDGNVPLAFPGGGLSRELALTAIRAARPLWPVVSTVAGGARQVVTGSTWTGDLTRQYAGSLAFVISTYQLRDKKGQVYPFSYSCVGFRISATEIVVPKEAIRPWEFDPQAAAVSVSRKAVVIPEGTDVILFLAGTQVQGPVTRPLNGLRLSRRDFSLTREGTKDAETTIVMDGSKRSKASLGRRVSTSNFALLQLPEQTAGVAQPTVTTSEVERPFWDKLAVFRGSVGSGGEIRFEALEVHGRREGARIVLESPVDRAAIGSPVVLPNGMLALLQDESGGSMLLEILSANRFTIASHNHATGTLPAGKSSSVSPPRLARMNL
jgi:hypothetical protein